jgi:hypothetical protein
MDQPRGRSPSAGGQHHSRGPSPQPYQQSTVPGVDPAVHQALTSGKFTNAGFNTSGFDEQQTLFQHQDFNQAAFQENEYGGNLNPQFSNNYMYNDPGMTNDWQSQNFSLNPSYTMNPQNNINPAELSKVSTPQDNQSPNLLSPENHSSPGPQAGSPGSTNGQYYTPQHSRHTSLDPSSAYGDPYTTVAFQNHRRNPSDISDGLSSASHSPYLGHAELHDPLNEQHSPFLAAQQDATNTFGIDNFSINESYRSPRLLPSMQDQQLPMGNDMLNPGMGLSGPEVYTTQPGSGHIRHASLGDMGQADQFAPPTINIEPAPVSRQQSFGPQGEQMEGALSPPSGSGSKYSSVIRSLFANVKQEGGIVASPISPALSDPYHALLVLENRHHTSPHRTRSPFVHIHLDRQPHASRHPVLPSPVALTKIAGQAHLPLIPATTSLISPTLTDRTPVLAVDHPAASKNIPQHSNVTCVKRSLLVRTISGPTSAHTPTNAPSSALFAAKLLHDNTIASATKGCTRARRNSSAAANCALNPANTGAAAVDLRAPTLWEGISAARQVESASNRCLMKRQRSEETRQCWNSSSRLSRWVATVVVFSLCRSR